MAGGRGANELGAEAPPWHGCRQAALLTGGECPRYGLGALESPSPAEMPVLWGSDFYPWSLGSSWEAGAGDMFSGRSSPLPAQSRSGRWSFHTLSSRAGFLITPVVGVL